MHLLENWQFWRVPSDYDLGYEDGQKPRFWNRWGGAGGLLPPGVYLYRVNLGADSGQDTALHSLSIAY